VGKKYFGEKGGKKEIQGDNFKCMVRVIKFF
jgi:hypothetical protein